MRFVCILFINLVTATQDAYDYIIVGGGTGGLVVANRLFENPGVPVLIVKARAPVLDNKNVMDVDLTPPHLAHEDRLGIRDSATGFRWKNTNLQGWKGVWRDECD